ncbi:hypothetical protein BSF41_41280 [Flavobacterium sp. ACN2]|uniref:DUF6934 family protein n=1 Tax=Flavobacterium sp. ACN2 TaxID=1975676 RepID=UPI000BB3DBFA|nr:hypothetical protein [Flavobacterium sp. ACN2]PBI84435.1 hypothetical protein BSF41_41280 [Flavobacterium sp. ACN2]
MNYKNYTLIKNELSTVFNFVSTGRKGNFRKVVVYSPTTNPNVYNLGFGDLKYDSLKKKYIVDDQVINDNGDIRMVLATVVKTAYEFTSVNPHITIFFRGSDTKRTNTYKRAIMLNLKELSETFDIFGARMIENNKIIDEPFDYKKDYDGFLIKRKRR